MINPDKFAPKLEKVSLEVSSITYECFIWHKNVEGQKYRGGIISFQGIYALGSSGRDHAFYIKWRINEFAERERLAGIVVDFSGLDYRWGDDLQSLHIASILRQEGAICIVVQPEAANAEIYQAYKWAFANYDLFTNVRTAFDAVNSVFVDKHKKRKSNRG